MNKLELLRQNFQGFGSLDNERIHQDYYHSKVCELSTVLGMSNTLSDQERADFEKELEMYRGHRDAHKDNIDEILVKLKEVGLSEDDYEKYCMLLEAEVDIHKFSNVNLGCSCGCGGDSISYEFVEEYENKCQEEIDQITKELSGT